jgi:hypothetical protein
MVRAWVAIFAVAWIAFAPRAAAQGAHDALVVKHAAIHGVPESLVRRVIRIESRGNPRIVSKGNYGLMQIRLGTARAMGYRGSAEGLLDPDTNMTYAVKYLAGAYRAAGCNADRAVRNYQRGYHGERSVRCGPQPQPAATQLAGQSTETSGAAPRTFAQRAAEADRTQPGDILKPKVVQTLSITRVVSAPQQTPAQAPAVASAQSKRVPLPLPARRPDASIVTANEPSATAAVSKQEVAKLDAESVPLPRAKSEAAEPEQPSRMKAASRPATKRVRVRKQADAPLNLVSFLKKLVTPEPKGRKRRASR